MPDFFRNFFLAWLLCAAGLIAGAILLAVRLIGDFHAGWNQDTLIWTVGIVIGFFVWEILIIAVTFALSFKSIKREFI